MMREMVEYIHRRHVREINELPIERVHFEPIDQQWITRFMRRHSELQSIIPPLIEVEWMKNITFEVLQW